MIMSFIKHMEGVVNETEKLRIVLRSSVDDDPFAGQSGQYARDTKTFLSVAELQGGQIVRPRLAMDSTEVQTMLEFGPLAHDALKILGPALIAWLHGRAGRRIEVSGFGIRIKANSVEEAERLIEKLAGLKGSQPTHKKPSEEDHE
jgi:hypothetical protein